jgi:hypothetical protein
MCEETRDYYKNFNQDNQSPSTDLNLELPKYEEGVLTAQLQHPAVAELALSKLQNANIFMTMCGEVRVHHKLLDLIGIFTQT